MDLHFVHTLPASREAVEAVLVDPRLVPLLASGSRVLASAEVRVYEDDGAELRREAFYVLREDAWPPLVRRMVPRVAWTERVVWRKGAFGSFVVLPEVPRPLERRVACAGTYHLASLEHQRTERRVEGSLVIDAPFVGASAEALLATVLATFFEEEAAVLAARAVRA